MPPSRTAEQRAQKASSSNRSSSLKRKRADVEVDEPASPQLPVRHRNPVSANKAASVNGVVKKTTTKSEDSVVADVKKESPKKRAAKAAKVEVPEEVQAVDEEGHECSSPASDDEEPEEKTKTPRKRKTREEKEAEAMPLAARSSGLRMFVGAHVSIAKGLENAITNSVHIGGNAFALFLKSQRKWDNPPLKNENRDAFLKACSEQNYDASSHVLPHGSYLVNLAHEDKDRAKQAYDAFIDDLRRCEALGIKLYNFHPGATNQSTLSEAIGRLSSQLNRALAETKTVIPVLENMAGSGSVIGSRFSDLRDIIANIKPEFKSRIGVCIDTCHSFAAGYDLRTPESFQKVMQEFDEVVGIQYLKAVHMNDSKAPLDSKRDLHQNIGLGFLGLRAFHSVMNEPRLQNIPLILETPCDRPDPSDPKGKKVIEDKSIWAKEIKLLESLIGMDPDGIEFKKLEKELSDKGKAERIKMQKQFDDKNAKTKKKMDKEREKGQKSLMEMMGKKKIKGNKSPVLSDEEEVEDT